MLGCAEEHVSSNLGHLKRNAQSSRVTLILSIPSTCFSKSVHILASNYKWLSILESHKLEIWVGVLKLGSTWNYQRSFKKP